MKNCAWIVAALAALVAHPRAATSQAASGGQPPPRHHHAVTYDAASRRVVIFAGASFDGNNQVILDDLWGWDGQRWSAMSLSTGVKLAPAKITTRREAASYVTA
jgi:hypothetical protein